MSSGDDEPESREAVATVSNSDREQRPSVLASVSLPPFAVACPVQAEVLGQAHVLGHARLGQWAVSIRVRTAPVVSLPTGLSATKKINNYNGTTSAMSIVEYPKASAPRQLQVEVGTAKGGDARGIPPRGRPV
jgi:hypothetical protein